MAEPKIEDGFMPIANELSEAFAGIDIPAQSYRLLWVIMRKTLGYQKSEDWISLSQFSQITGLADKAHIIRNLNKLVSMNIIVKNGNGIARNGHRGNPTYSLNTDYETWRVLPKKAKLPLEAKSVAKAGQRSLPQMAHTKYNYTKDNITKNIINVNSTKIAEFTKLYHSLCPFGIKVQAMSPKRLYGIKAILKTHPDLSWWEGLLGNKVARSPFLRGEIPPSDGHRQFKLSIDFLCVEHNLVKIIEGNYDNQPGSDRKSSFLDQCG
jgi:phage replication O-like protein O